MEFTRLRDLHGHSTKRTQKGKQHGAFFFFFEHCHPLYSSWSCSFIELSVRNFSSVDFIAEDQTFHWYGQVEELFLSVEVAMSRQPFISGNLMSKPPSTLSKEEYGKNAAWF